MRSIAATTARLGAAVILLALHAAPLDEQYFGRNKVRGEKFHFRVLQSPHFDIYHYSAESTATADGLNWLVGAVHIPYLIGSLADVTVWRRPQSLVGFPSALCWRTIVVPVCAAHHGCGARAPLWSVWSGRGAE